MEQTYISILSNFGFPICMVFWFMLRTEKVINNNTKIMERVIQKL